MTNRSIPLFLFLIAGFLSCKKENRNEGNEGPGINVMIKDSLTGTPIAGAIIATRVYGLSDYDDCKRFVEKIATAPESGTAVLKFETEDEKHWYNYFVSLGHLYVSVEHGDHYYKEYQVQTYTSSFRTIKLLAYPKYVFDFTNTSGNHLNDDVVFSFKSWAPSINGYAPFYQKMYTGKELNNRSLTISWPFDVHQDDHLSLLYELRTYPAEIPLDTGLTLNSNDGTTIHIPIEF